MRLHRLALDVLERKAAAVAAYPCELPPHPKNGTAAAACMYPDMVVMHGTEGSWHQPRGTLSDQLGA